LKTVAIFYQGRKEVTSDFAAKLAPMLQQRGYQVRTINLLNEAEECSESSFRGCEVVFVLGGDGTIVHAARVCSCLNLPIVGINFGRVGFLTEIEPQEVETHLNYYLDSDPSVWVDERTMLSASLEQGGHTEEFLALNDVVIARGTWPRMVHVKIWIDDYFYNITYSDGIIVSTATGSTILCASENPRACLYAPWRTCSGTGSRTSGSMPSSTQRTKRHSTGTCT